jgi:hypothetical protein
LSSIKRYIDTKIMSSENYKNLISRDSNLQRTRMVGAELELRNRLLAI